MISRSYYSRVYCNRCRRRTPNPSNHHHHHNNESGRDHRPVREMISLSASNGRYKPPSQLDANLFAPGLRSITRGAEPNPVCHVWSLEMASSMVLIVGMWGGGFIFFLHIPFEMVEFFDTAFLLFIFFLTTRGGRPCPSMMGDRSRSTSSWYSSFTGDTTPHRYTECSRLSRTARTHQSTYPS